MDTTKNITLFDALESKVDSHVILSALTMKDHTLNTGPFKREEVVTNLIFVLYKDFYLEQNKRLRYSEHPREVLPDRDPDSDRRASDRAMNAMRERKEKEFAGPWLDPTYMRTISTPTKYANDIKPYYHYSAVDEKAISCYNQSQNTSGYSKFISLYMGGRMIRSKDVSGDEIEDAYKRIFAHINMKSKIQDSKEWIEDLFDLASLEISSTPVFLYAVAKHMDAISVKEPSYFLRVLYEPVFTTKGPGMFRFLHHRHLFIANLFDKEKAPSTERFLKDLIALHVDVHERAKRDFAISMLLKQACTESIDEAYRYFHEKYNLFDDYSAIAEGDAERWTAKFVKAYRSAVKEITSDGKEYAAKLEAKKRKKSKK